MYVTAKAEPNDFNCILVLEDSIISRRLSALEYYLVSRRSARRLYGGDIVPVLPDSVRCSEYVEFFQTNREGERVGMVEIDL